jgi:hypothetical protein
MGWDFGETSPFLWQLNSRSKPQVRSSSQSQRTLMALPNAPLPIPICRSRDGPKFFFGHRIATAFDLRQKQNLLLEVRSEAEEIHDLRHPRSRDLPDRIEFGRNGARP